MHRVNLFVEDRGHEIFLRTLIHRIAKKYVVDIETVFSNARGGHGKVMGELKRYLNNLQSDDEILPDLLIIAIDGNCKGFLGCKQEIDKILKDYPGSVVYAIPDPHIERWLLLDAAAFKKVLGKGCSAPTQKCERDLYKRLLLQAVRNTGVNPPLGGIEYAEDLVNTMDLDSLERMGDSFSKLLKELRYKFQEWLQADHQQPQTPPDTSNPPV